MVCSLHALKCVNNAYVYRYIYIYIYIYNPSVLLAQTLGFCLQRSPTAVVEPGLLSGECSEEFVHQHRITCKLAGFLVQLLRRSTVSIDEERATKLAALDTGWGSCALGPKSTLLCESPRDLSPDACSPRAGRASGVG